MGLVRPITIGEIDYANAWPLFNGLDGHLEHVPHGIKSCVPSELNRLLHAGELDVSAISSFSYGQFASQYVLMPGLSVGSIGRVHSILLFLKQPIEKKRPERIAVTTTSETSVNLLKIIMELRYECSPSYIPAAPDLDAMLKDADAALLIGDPAIHASWRKGELYAVDLGELWNEWTGLGMTYAVVAARKEAVSASPDNVRAVYNAMQSAKRYNLSYPDFLVDKACSRLGGNAAYWTMYFRSLQYDFGLKLQEGLELYFRYARQLGLLRQDAKLDFYEEQSPKKVK